jgi:glycerophosphoryl diester phosphodiesterase
VTSLNFIPPVIAHRGASGYAPENTMVAFIKAVQMGIKWVEFDVVQAACGNTIVFHDETLDRVTNEKGFVYLYPYSYLRTLDAGSWFDPKFSGEHIPTLREVIEFFQATKINANVEIKVLSGQIENFIVRVLKELSPYLSRHQSRILFSSFSIEALQVLRKHSPDCQIGLLMHEWLPDWRQICLSLQCASLHVYDEILTFKAAQEVKAMNKTLLCYTVNDPERAKELYSWGVDAVFSDLPDLIL